MNTKHVLLPASSIFHFIGKMKHQEHAEIGILAEIDRIWVYQKIIYKYSHS